MGSAGTLANAPLMSAISGIPQYSLCHKKHSRCTQLILLGALLLLWPEGAGHIVSRQHGHLRVTEHLAAFAKQECGAVTKLSLTQGLKGRYGPVPNVWTRYQMVPVISSQCQRAMHQLDSSGVLALRIVLAVPVNCWVRLGISVKLPWYCHPY